MRFDKLNELYEIILQEQFGEYSTKTNYGDYRNLFFNPLNNNTPLKEIQKRFERSNGQVFSGDNQMIFMRPEWNYVVKMYQDDSAFKKFIRMIDSQPDKSCFPKILQRHENLIPNFARIPKFHKINIIVMEKLVPISESEYEEYIKPFVTVLEEYIKARFDFESSSSDGDALPENIVELQKQMDDITSSYEDNPKAQKMLSALYELIFKFMITVRQNSYVHYDTIMDLHSGNFMKRMNGSDYDLVITDPFYNQRHVARVGKHSKYKTMNMEVQMWGGSETLMKGGEDIGHFYTRFNKIHQEQKRKHEQVKKAAR